MLSESHNLPVTPKSRSALLLGQCSRHMQKLCVVYSRAKRLFILEQTRLLLFLNHLAMHIPTRKCRIKQYTDL
jgi:hypothetical protein